MDDERSHASRRRTLTICGVLLIVIGVPLLVTGIVKFTSTMGSPPPRSSTQEFFDDPAGTMDRDNARWDADMEAKKASGLGGMAFFALGVLALGVGSSLVTFANRGKLARYTANEVAPVVADAVSYVATESAADVGAAARALQGATPPAEVVKVKCRACGSLEREKASFCSSCGKPL